MVIADTGFWLALTDRRDAFHEAAKGAYAALREPLVTTWPVMTETSHLFLARHGAMAPVALLANYAQGMFEIFALDVDHARRMQTLIKRYADLPMDLADASLVVLSEHLGHGRILSTDQRDFHTYRWKDRQPFENLLMSK